MENSQNYLFNFLKAKKKISLELREGSNSVGHSIYFTRNEIGQKRFLLRTFRTREAGKIELLYELSF
jgi:hypothetical protein